MGTEPGLDLGGCEAPKWKEVPPRGWQEFPKTNHAPPPPPDLEAIHQTKRMRGWHGIPAPSPVPAQAFQAGIKGVDQMPTSELPSN